MPWKMPCSAGAVAAVMPRGKTDDPFGPGSAIDQCVDQGSPRVRSASRAATVISLKASVQPSRRVRFIRLGWKSKRSGSVANVRIKVNGVAHAVHASANTPLLYVLHNELHLHSPRFGCGLAQCGACSVLLDGNEIRSCVTPVAAAAGGSITTLEGLPALWASQTGATSASALTLHPLQQAWIDLQVPHCGYCQSGMMIQALDLLATAKRPSEDQIRTALNGHICRCGTYPRILTAVQRAAAVMAAA